MPQLLMRDKKWYVADGNPNLKPGDHVKVVTRKGERTVIVGAHVAHVYEVTEWVELETKRNGWTDQDGNPTKPPVRW